MDKYRLSARSLSRLLGCHPRLIELISSAIKTTPFDFAVICGRRNEIDQNEAYDKGNSKLKYPMSMHNKSPSLAIDIAPYPIDWDDIEKFKILSYHIKIIAYQHKIKIKWGGDWNSFKDYPHYQLGE